jgi:hypothetical protein
MATRVSPHRRAVLSTVHDSYVNATTASPPGASAQNTLQQKTIDTDTKELIGASSNTAYQATWTGWRSEWVQADVAISGAITVQAYGKSTIAGAGHLRVKIFQRHPGGSDLEFQIGQIDFATLTTATAAYVGSFTPSPFTLARGDRIYYRVYAVRDSVDFDTATFTFSYDTTGIWSYVEFTEAITFYPEATIMILRRTTAAAIGTFFDVLPTRGAVAATTGVVQTNASAEKQWTRTSGGTLLEWISPRFLSPWKLSDAAQFATIQMTANESAAQANCAVRVKWFRRAADGTETLLATSDLTAELTTSAASLVFFAPTINDIAMFAEDDRLVVRVYIIPASGLTMGSGQTCTLTYDVNTQGSLGDCRFTLYDMTEFKAETDPARQFIVPSGGSLEGLSNGQ